MANLELTGTRPPSAASLRPMSSKSLARPKSSYHVISDKSNVDELLFTSHHSKIDDDTVNYKSPWVKSYLKNDHTKISKQTKMRPLFWAPGDRPTFTSHSDRTLGTKSKHSLDLNKYRPVKQVPSFCDETLFGKRLEEPSFAAPWAEKTRAPRPFLFSPLDYTKLTREGSSVGERYSASGTLDGRPPSRQGRRPVTAGTRPVTVESAQDMEKPTWRP